MPPFVAESLFHIKCRNYEKYGIFESLKTSMNRQILQRNGLTISGIKSLCCHFKVLLDPRQIQKAVRCLQKSAFKHFVTRMHKIIAANNIPDMRYVYSCFLCIKLTFLTRLTESELNLVR